MLVSMLFRRFWSPAALTGNCHGMRMNSMIFCVHRRLFFLLRRGVRAA